MDIDDVSTFLQAIKGDPYELPLFVDLFTGLRQGELLGLTWDCVDFEKGTLLINKQHNRAKGEKEYHFSPLKNSRPRCLTPASAVMDALREQKKRQQEWAEAADQPGTTARILCSRRSWAAISTTRPSG